jgi:hypothetical protein
LGVFELCEDTQRILDHLLFAFFCFVCREIGDENVAVDVDPPHFFFARKRTVTLCLTVLRALNETVSPDLVLNFTLVGFATVLAALNWIFFLAISSYYHRLLDGRWHSFPTRLSATKTSPATSAG